MPNNQTVFVTGANGFIAKHIILRLLEKGYRVRGSVRGSDRAEAVRRTLATHLSNPDLSRKNLEFVELDLARDEGWKEALEGVDILVHTASPFPFAQPKDENEVVLPAVEGAIRALRASKANNTNRVIFTSSGYAIIDRDLEPGRTVYTEDDWSDHHYPASTPYSRSKVRAEKSAWDFVGKEAPEIDLTVILPGFVLGPPLDTEIGTSMKVVKRLLDGRDPALPRFGFPVVDVRDVAEAHVRAISRPETVGKRITVAADFLWFSDMAEAIKEAFPDRRIVTREAPNWLIRVLALFDKEVRVIAPVLGRKRVISNDRARKLLDIDFIDPRESAVASARFLIENQCV